ncbi:MAG: nitroreductase [Cyclobacteriaceae bacterium]
MDEAINLGALAKQIIRERRSIYTNLFSGEDVPENIIRDMVESAQWAPTHKLTQPWRFSVFSGEGRERLARYQAGVYMDRSKAKGKFDPVKYDKMLKKPLECSHVIAIGMHRDDDERIPETEEVCAVAAAVQNMWLVASANRIGCYWSTGGITFYDNIGEFFGWEKQDRLLGFLYIGMPKISKWPDGKRESMDKRVNWFPE